MKQCTKCKKDKDISEFYRDKRTKSELYSACKKCCYKESREYKKTHKEYLKEYRREYIKKHKEYFREYQKKYCRDRNKKKYHSDIQFKIKNLLRGRLYKAIKGNYKAGSSIKDLGCSIDELKFYIEGQFQQDMIWGNWGKIGVEKVWNIDHKIPLASFDLTDRKQFLRAIHYTNLQPLWAIENLSKHDKVESIYKII